MKLNKSALAAAAGLTLLGVAVAGPALADTNTGNTTTLAAVGSDTTQDVMEGLSLSLTDSNGNPVLSNYLATPADGHTISTRSNNANCTFAAPQNSGGGRDALSAALRGAAYGGSTNLTGCVDVARSSSGSNPATSPGVGKMTYIPFATDSVSFATLSVSSVGHRLAKSDLVAIYKANTGNCIFQPLLPKLGSGTRSFFLAQLGISDVAIGATGGPGTCVKDDLGTTSAPRPIQEHDGRVLTNGNQLVPFSTAQYIGQGSDTIENKLGRASLGAIDFSANPDSNLSGAQSPVSLKPTFTFNRPVYNVVSTDAITSGAAGFNQKVVDTFVGGGSKVCSADPIVSQYGFAIPTNCGDTTKKNTN